MFFKEVRISFKNNNRIKSFQLINCCQTLNHWLFWFDSIASCCQSVVWVWVLLVFKVGHPIKPVHFYPIPSRIWSLVGGLVHPNCYIFVHQVVACTSKTPFFFFWLKTKTPFLWVVFWANTGGYGLQFSLKILHISSSRKVLMEEDATQVEKKKEIGRTETAVLVLGIWAKSNCVIVAICQVVRKTMKFI